MITMSTHNGQSVWDTISEGVIMCLAWAISNCQAKWRRCKGKSITIPHPHPALDPLKPCLRFASRQRVTKGCKKIKINPSLTAEGGRVTWGNNEIRLTFCRRNPAPFKLVSTSSGRLKSLPPFLKHLLASLCTINHRIACFHAHTLSQSSSVAKNIKSEQLIGVSTRI